MKTRPILLGLIFCSNLVHANDYKSLALDQPLSLNESSYLLAYEHAGEEATHKMVHMAITKAAIEFTIAGDHLFRSNAEKERYRQTAMQSEYDKVNGVNWRNSYTEASLKGVVGLSSLVPKYGKAIPVDLMKKGIESWMGALSTEGTTPVSDGQNVINVAASIFQGARDPKNPKHEFYKSLVKMFHPGINPEIDYGLRSDVRNAKENLTKREYAARKVEPISKSAAQKIRKGKIKEAEQELKEQAKETLAKIDPELLEKGKFEKNVRDAREATAGLKAISTAFLIFNEQEPAIFFDKASRVTSAIENLNQTYLSRTKENPMQLSVAGGWVGLVFSVVQLLSATENRSEMQALHEQLQQLAQQIMELRKEMRAEFDLLKRRLDIDFNGIHIDVKNTQASLARLEETSRLLVEAMDRVSGEVKEGVSFLWRQQMVSTRNRCLGVHSATGKSFALSPETASDCRDQFVNLAVAPYSSSVSPSDSDQDVRKLNGKEFSALSEFLSQNESRYFKRTNHPANWLIGTKALLDFFVKHPEYKHLAKNSATSDRDLGLENVKAKGQDIFNTIQELALTPIENNEYRLKATLMNKLLDKYKDEMEVAVENSISHSDTIASRGPRPTIYGGNQETLIDEKYDFIGKPVDFCPGVERKVTWENISYWRSHPSAFKNPNNRTSPEQEKQIENAMLRAMLSPPGPQFFKVDPSFLELLPRKAVWASRAGYKNMKITPCFAAMSVPKLFAGYEKGKIMFRVSFVFTMEFYMTLGEAQNISKPVLIRQIQAERNIEIPGYTFRHHPKYPFSMIYNIWDGQHMYANGGDFNWESIKNHAGKYFKVVDLTPDQEYVKFEKSYDAYLANQRTKARSALIQQLDNTKVSADRLLALIATLGLDPTNSHASEFMSWLISVEGLPTPREVALLQMDLGQPKDSILKTIEDKVQEARNRIDALSSEKSLRPRTVEYGKVLEGLNKL